MLIVIIKSIMLNVVRLLVVMLNVIMLNIVSPKFSCISDKLVECHYP